MIVRLSRDSPYAIVLDRRSRSGWALSRLEAEKLAESGLPPIVGPGEIPVKWLKRLKGELCKLSISHDSDYASATALADLSHWKPARGTGEKEGDEETAGYGKEIDQPE